MCPNLLNKAIATSFSLIDLPDGKSKHFAYLVSGNKIIGFGYNKHKTHPYLLKWGYKDRPPAIHAEAAAILSTRQKGNAIIVVRVNRLNQVRLSRPCPCCLAFLQHAGVSRIWYTTDYGWENEIICS